MINTSAEYQAAIVGSPRRVEILAVVDISDPDMTCGSVASSGLAAWSKAHQLVDKVFDAPKRYATLERNRWLLDGTFRMFPDDYQVSDQVGVATDTISGDDCSFLTPVWVQQSFENIDVLQAFSVFFSNDPNDGVPEDFTVEVLQGGTAYYTKTVTGNTDTEISLADFTVHTPDAIKVTCTKWSLPGRRMRVMDIIPGAYERWTSRMLVSFNVTQQGAFSCLSLPYGTATISMDNKSRRFEPRSKSGLFQSIEARQGIELYIGLKTESGAVERCKLGVFYQSGDGWKTGDNSLTMQWYLVDIIGLVSDRTFIVPETLPTTLSGWLASIVSQLGANFANRYSVDENYANLPATVNSAEDVTDKKCGDILRWVCQATSTFPRADAETGYLTAEPLWNQGAKVTLDNLTAYPTMKANESLAALIFKLADENKTEYVVSGNATSSEKTVSISNPFLHTQEQALMAARLILSCYGGNVIETTGRGNPSSEIGDVDTMWLDDSQATAARRMMQNFQIQSGVLQGCKSRLLQANGSHLWTEFAVITESCTWTAPAGVTQLRVVIGSGGQGGGKGQDGILEHKARNVIAAYGEKGVDGSGGKVWNGVIDINPQQTFQVHIGAGGVSSNEYGVAGSDGEDTTFGAYSSANGHIYDVGYTDIATGQVFSRTGVKLPLPGTSDGGAGGDGGEPGAGRYHISIDENGNEHYYFVKHKDPGPGRNGASGATGFVMISWEVPS